MAIVISNKKGQSIVEVMISLTILAFVLSASLTLIISVVNLALDARNMTKVVTFAESGLAEAVTSSETGCQIVASGAPAGSVLADPSQDEWVSYNPGVDDTIRRISWTESAGTVNGITGFSEANVLVSWTDKKGNVKQYQLQRLIRNAGF